MMERVRSKDRIQISVVTLLYKSQQCFPRMSSSLRQASKPMVTRTTSLVSQDWSVEVQHIGMKQ